MIEIENKLNQGFQDLLALLEMYYRGNDDIKNCINGREK